MPLPTDRTYPPKATNAAWQKKKTLADKAAKKTGLGPKLTAAQASWKDISWNDLDFSRHTPKNAEEANANLVKARKAAIYVFGVRGKLDEASASAKTVSGNKSLSKQARNYAATIETELEQAEKRLAVVNEALVKEFADAAKRLEEAKRELTDVELYDGRTLLGKAAKADHDHKVVTIAAVDWKVPANARIAMVGRTLNVRATAGDRTLFVEDMKVAVANGNALTLQS